MTPLLRPAAAAFLLGLVSCSPPGPRPAPVAADRAPAPEPARIGLQVFPKGDRFPFLGYSGIPARDARHGFSVAGPSYGTPDQRRAYLAQCEAAGLATPWFIGLDVGFHSAAPARPTPEAIREAVTAQVREFAGHPNICWWYLTPEELRPWRSNEMQYLALATEAIRAADPLGRPVWMYDPNHRAADALAQTGRHLDLIGKGFYCNLAGYTNDRVWIRWSMEQQTNAIARLAGDGRVRHALVLPELCADPADPALDHLIPRWTRHDVYLGLMTGGKGVAIWSLFPRAEVRRTWEVWYDAYARLADELTGPGGLGEVFLRGRPSAAYAVDLVSGPRELELRVGPRTALETNTTAAAERDPGVVRYPSLAVTCLEHGGSHWLFLCNSSSRDAVRWAVREPLPAGVTAVDALTGQPARMDRGRPGDWLPPLGVRVLRLR